MPADLKRPQAHAPGISVVTCTNKPSFLRTMFANYKRQRWSHKEWIIVVNSNRTDLSRYNQMAAQFKHVRVYRLPVRYTLGACLNFASAHAKHSYIAKMDDDEYYAPNYLPDMMRAFRKSGADVVGKRAYFIHLKGRHLLIQRFYTQNRFVSILAGGTFVYKKKVWRQVKFSNRSLGEDVLFCRACRSKGFRLYAGDRYNFCALRRKQPNSHTWKKSDQEFLTHPQTRIIAYGDNYKKYVVRRSIEEAKNESENRRTPWGLDHHLHKSPAVFRYDNQQLQKAAPQKQGTYHRLEQR